MRVLLSAMLVGSAVLVSACSGGSDVSLRRSAATSEDPTPPSSGTNKGSKGTTPSSPSQTPSQPQSPSPTPSSGTTPPPATPDTGTTPPPSACQNVKCFAAAGFGGCKATDAAAATVTMGCQGGVCACFVGNQQTSAAFEGDVRSSDEAKQLFLTNCDCN